MLLKHDIISQLSQPNVEHLIGSAPSDIRVSILSSLLLLCLLDILEKILAIPSCPQLISTDIQLYHNSSCNPLFFCVIIACLNL